MMVVLVVLVPGSPLRETALSSTCATQQTDRWDRMGRGVASYPGLSMCLGLSGFYLHAAICPADHDWIMYLTYVTLNSINFQLWTITFLV